ncbi:MAG: hypothetical protein K2O40_11380, partial [Lachnospiraceae bacterium]|nr:hypothetical protein [Lachnospiraceae bacterium]
MADIIGMQPAGRVLPLFKGDYDNDIVYEQTDVVLYNTSSYIAIQDTVGNAPPEPDVNRNEYWQLVAKGMTDISDSTVKFTQAETRADIKSGETSSTLFGKIMKWFSDLKPHCFISPVNNLLATVAGTALDAVQGKVLYDRITQLNSDFSKWHKSVKWFADSNGLNYVIFNASDLGLTAFPEYMYITATARYTKTNQNNEIYVTGIYYDALGTELKVFLNNKFSGGLYIN